MRDVGESCWRIVVPGHPPSPNRQRGHWAKRWAAVTTWRDDVAWQARAVRPDTPLARAAVVATLVYTRRPLRDHDNCVASLKQAIDGLKVGGLIVDDSPDRLTLEVRQEMGTVKETVLEIREVCDA